MMAKYLSDAAFNASPIDGGHRAYAGRDFSAEAANFDAQRIQLATTVINLPKIAPQHGWSDSVNQLSNSRAYDFVMNLPTNRRLPKCSVDEDGNVLFAWDGADGAVLTVEGALLHLCVRPGRNSEHKDAVPFPGQYIPPTILDGIPVRNA